MMILHYSTKKELKASIGQPLKYEETSMFGPEYKSDGMFVGSNRPHINPSNKKGWREFFAQVTMKDGKIQKVV